MLGDYAGAEPDSLRGESGTRLIRPAHAWQARACAGLLFATRQHDLHARQRPGAEHHRCDSQCRGGGSSNSGIAAANAAGFATSAALSARPALVDSSHDPFFAVSGSILAPSSSTTPAPSFSATFTVNVTYTRKLSSRDVTTGLTASFNAVKTVDQESKAIRILFQPLGDKSG